MKKFMKMVLFVALFVVIPMVSNLLVLRVIKDVAFINSIREETPTSVFVILDIISMSLLALFVKYVRKENPITFASIKRITFLNGITCAGVGILLAVFTNSLVNISGFKMASVGGSIDWILSGNIILVLLVTLINSAYKEFCFRGLAFNELKSVIPVSLALVIQAMFYAGELIYFGNSPSIIFYGFLGQLAFGLVFYFGKSIYSSLITQVCCSTTLALIRRTEINGHFTQNLSIVLFSVSIAALLAVMAINIRRAARQQEPKGDCNVVHPF
ncbi:CPBP family glutamic-type intramembrane protease [Acetivibrio cellulolyticus]|uniref:CPBP family glutamic-type intramembrane protease n=1 Tax=Acetivibrio cellulolyticus TaxID=35830 RepID=UPI0001E301B3|nr:CPBP family glutamic-type intramembrane protease [Acetivibrio cellulolyticus]